MLRGKRNTTTMKKTAPKTVRKPLNIPAADTTPPPAVEFDKTTGTWIARGVGATNSFGIGSRVNVGNCAYIPVEGGGHGAWRARTLDDARQMALDFVKNVQ